MTSEFESDVDARKRMAAFKHVEDLMIMQKYLTSADIDAGFEFQGKKIRLWHPPRGICKPPEMDYLLSITSSFPSRGKKIDYEDQVTVVNQFLDGDQDIEYDFQGNPPNPESRDNQLMRIAHEKRIPIIYFLGIAPQKYVVLWPTFIANWDGSRCKCRLDFNVDYEDVDTLENIKEYEHSRAHSYLLLYKKTDDWKGKGKRNSGMEKAGRRVYQGIFRLKLLEAYGYKCAFSGLCMSQLLDAAHIIPYSEQKLSRPIVNNGMLLSKIHHTAYDRNLLGVDSNYKIHVSNKLRKIRDGPMLDVLIELKGEELKLPKCEEDYPDKKSLEIRYKRFKQQA